MSSETIMITGAMGCIGAWAVRHLVNEGVNIVATDLSTDPVRPRLLMSEEDVSAVTWPARRLRHPRERAAAHPPHGGR